jgi:hypothetical protein
MGQPGTSSWWNQWQALFKQMSFRVVDCVDIPFSANSLQPYAAFSLDNSAWTRQHWYNDFDDVSAEHVFQHRCLSIQKHFNFFGGSRASSFEGYAKQYLTLQMSQHREHGIVECLYDLDSEETLVHWTDSASYWKQYRRVEEIKRLYQQFRRPKVDCMPTVTEQMKANSPIQYASFAQVVRESYLCQPFDCFSEKTFRAFLHQQLVIPVNYNSVATLTELGFKFPLGLFNYQYSLEPDFFLRIEKLNHSLEQFFNISIEDLRNYFVDNFQGLFLHNSDLAKKYTQLLV